MATTTDKTGCLKILTTIFDNKNTLLLTAISASFSAVVCAIAYVRQRLLLATWNIAPEAVNVMENQSAVYYIMFGILLMIGTIAFQLCLRPIALAIVIDHKIHKILKREIKVEISILKKLPKQEKQARIPALKYHKSIVKRATTRLIKSSIGGIIILASPLVLLFVLFQAAAAEEVNILALAIGAVIIVIIALGGCILQARVLVPQKVKHLEDKSKQINEKNALDLLRKTVTVIQSEYKPVRISDLKQTLKTISRIDVYSSIVSVIIISLFLIFTGMLTPLSKTNFWLIEENGQTYAAVFFNGNEVFLKEAIIDEENNSIKISLNKQLRINYLNKNMVYKQFHDMELLKE